MHVMEKWFFSVMKDRGFRRHRRWVGYVARIYGEVHVFVRLNPYSRSPDSWAPEFGINLPNPFGEPPGPGMKIEWHSIYMGEFSPAGHRSDSWTEEERESLLQSIDTIIVPWADSLASPQSMIDHYRHRIDNGIHHLPDDSDEKYLESVGGKAHAEAAMQLLALYGKPDDPTYVGRFWEFIAILYEQVGDAPAAIDAANEFIRYCRSTGRATEKAAQAERLILQGQWPCI